MGVCGRVADGAINSFSSFGSAYAVKTVLHQLVLEQVRCEKKKRKEVEEEETSLSLSRNNNNFIANPSMFHPQSDTLIGNLENSSANRSCSRHSYPPRIARLIEASHDAAVLYEFQLVTSQ